jgi:hypothetical protein
MKVPAPDNLQEFLRFFEPDANGLKGPEGMVSWMEAAFWLDEAFGNRVNWRLLRRGLRHREAFRAAALRIHHDLSIVSKFGGSAGKSADARLARLVRQFRRNQSAFDAVDTIKTGVDERLEEIKLMILILGGAGRIRGAVTCSGDVQDRPQPIADEAWLQDANRQLFETGGVMQPGNAPFAPVGAPFLQRETLKIWLGFISSKQLKAPAALEAALLAAPPPDELRKELLARFGVTGKIGIAEANIITDASRPGLDPVERYNFSKVLVRTSRRMGSDGDNGRKRGHVKSSRSTRR